MKTDFDWKEVMKLEAAQKSREDEWDRLTTAIATHHGWTSVARRLPCVSDGRTTCLTGFPPGYTGDGKSHWGHERVPRYATDLYAMRELWAKLDRKQRRRAQTLLEIIVYREHKADIVDGWPYCLDDVKAEIATAKCSWMAEAYLKTVTEKTA